jgi:DNA-binding transcriptional regulator YbjK
LLADKGARGLTHRKVDHAAGVPDGTTSFHFRSRAALLDGVVDRLTELDLADLAAVTDESPERSKDMAPRLARAVIESLTEPRLTRTKARFEVMLQASRDPDLLDKMRGTFAGFMQLSRAAITQLQPAGATPDSKLIGEQTYAAMTFINGVMVGYVCGDRSIRSAEQLNDLLVDLVAGVAKTSRAGVRP